MKQFFKLIAKKYIKKIITTDALSSFYTHNRI